MPVGPVGDDAHAGRADQAHAVAPGDPMQSASATAPSGSASANPVAMTTTPRTRLAAHWRDHFGHLGGGHGDHREVDVVDDVGSPAANAGTLATWGVVGFTG